MSVFNRSEEQRCLDELRHHDEEVIGSLCRLSDRAPSPSSHMEQEKRIRREIANSNERRRMQSINAGFQSLRTLLPHHEGEKLSKAAILQQTAEYIYQLEQEKTSLLSQNCQLKRLINQHEGAHEASSAKKRKLDTLLPVVSESSDEGIGSMSPEPVALVTSVTAVPAPPTEAADREMIDLRVQLDRERRLRMLLQDQVRTLELQVYPERLRGIGGHVALQYHQPEVLDTNPRIDSMIQETAAAVAQLQVVSAASLPPVAQTTTIVATVSSPPPPPRPRRVATPPPPPPSPPPPSPPPPEQRLPSVLEAAIKAEPKVEVERLPSPGSDDVTPQTRLYLANTSRQNLETIVEAIRHLEGDHLFSDEPSPAQQDAPLALTKASNPALIKVEMDPFLHFHTQPQASVVAALQQQRPGVIVVKQHT